MKFVKDFMRKNFTLISPYSSLRSAEEKIIQKGTETLFVTENDQVVGVIGIRDLFTLPIPASFGGSMPKREEENLIWRWTNTTVDYLMNVHMISVPKDYPLMVAAEMMINGGKHPLAILQGKQLVGIIYWNDIVQAFL